MSIFDPGEFKPIDDWYKIKIHLFGDKTLVAVASNEVDRRRLVRQEHVPARRTGVLISLPTGKIYLLKKSDYERFKEEEDRILGNRDNRRARAAGESPAEYRGEKMAGPVQEQKT